MGSNGFLIVLVEKERLHAQHIYTSSAGSNGSEPLEAQFEIQFSATFEGATRAFPITTESFWVPPQKGQTTSFQRPSEKRHNDF